MKKIEIFDCDFEDLEKVCDDNGLCFYELIEMLVDYLEDVKRDNNLI